MVFEVGDVLDQNRVNFCEDLGSYGDHYGWNLLYDKLRLPLLVEVRLEQEDHQNDLSH